MVNIVPSTNVPTAIALSRRTTTRTIAEAVLATQQAVRSRISKMVIIVPNILARHLDARRKSNTVQTTVLLTNAIVAITKKLTTDLTVFTIPVPKMDAIGINNMVRSIVSHTHVWQEHAKTKL